jgi:hypothetical protein
VRSSWPCQGRQSDHANLKVVVDPCSSKIDPAIWADTGSSALNGSIIIDPTISSDMLARQGCEMRAMSLAHLCRRILRSRRAKRAARKARLLCQWWKRGVTCVPPTPRFAPARGLAFLSCAFQAMQEGFCMAGHRMSPTSSLSFQHFRAVGALVSWKTHHKQMLPTTKSTQTWSSKRTLIGIGQGCRAGLRSTIG